MDPTSGLHHPKSIIWNFSQSSLIATSQVYRCSTQNLRMAPSAISDDPATAAIVTTDTTILSLRKALTTETVPLARRFRALFSLKHLACLDPPTAQTLPAIEAISAAFSSPSALLKHELAYCLGQTKNPAAVSHLRGVLEDKEEDAMCRHEAAEALGALGYVESLRLLRELRDDQSEVEVVRETCDIAVARIEWENGDARAEEKLKPRYPFSTPTHVDLKV